MDTLINAMKFNPSNDKSNDLNIFKSLLYENKLSADDINSLIYQNFVENSIQENSQGDSIHNNFHHTIIISDILIQYTKDMNIDEYMNSYDKIVLYFFHNIDISEIYLFEYYIKHVENINNDILKYCLFIAIEQNLVQHLNILLLAGADVRTIYNGDYIIKGRNAFMYAVQESSYEIIKTILDSGIDIKLILDSKDSKGNTAIMYIPFRTLEPLPYHYILIELLIQYGADVNICNTVGRTLLASYYTKTEVVKLIKPHLTKENIINTFKILINKQITKNIPAFINEFGLYDDHVSQFYSLQYILDQCATINILRSFRDTIKALLNLNAYRGFMINVKVPTDRAMHYSKLLYQAVDGSTAMNNIYYSFFIELLLNMHVSLVYKDNKGRDAYDLALGIGVEKRYVSLPITWPKDISIELPVTNIRVLESFNKYFNNNTLQLSCYLLSLNNTVPLTNIPQYIIDNIIEQYS